MGSVLCMVPNGAALKTVSVLCNDCMLCAHAVLCVCGMQVCGDDVAHGKPAPDGFLLAAEKIGVHPSRCVGYEGGWAMLAIPCGWCHELGCQVQPEAAQGGIAATRVVGGRECVLHVYVCMYAGW